MDKRTTFKDIIKGGTILQGFGTKYLVSVTVAGAIDKVKWSIVELNTKGKVYSDFYLGMKQMRQLCEDILNGKAGKKFADDAASPYPGAYKYVTGENGNKKLNIGGGQKGIRVQIQEKKGEGYDNKMSVVMWDDLKEMAFLFQLVTGLIPVMKGTYYGGLLEAFVSGEAERNSHFGSFKASEDGEYATPDETPSPAPTPAPTPVKKEEKEVIFENPPKPEKVTPEEPTIPSGNNVKDFRMKVTSALIPMGKDKKALKGITEDNRELAVVFEPSILGSIEWKDFEPKTLVVGSLIRFKGEELADRIIAKAI